MELDDDIERLQEMDKNSDNSIANSIHPDFDDPDAGYTSISIRKDPAIVGGKDEMDDNSGKQNLRQFVFFGPPGIGKSTIIDQHNGYDMETSFPTVDYVKLKKATVIGGAGHDHKDEMFKGMTKVLLTLPQNEYDERRESRDEDEPTKASQDRHEIENWLNKESEFDEVVKANEGEVAKLLKS